MAKEVHLSLRYLVPAALDLLKQMIGPVQMEEERTLLEKLTWLLTGIANGKLPDVVQDTARCTQGVAIPKKDGKPRPLGMRETLVNLATKTLLQTVKDRIMTTFDGVILRLGR